MNKHHFVSISLLECTIMLKLILNYQYFNFNIMFIIKTVCLLKMNRKTRYVLEINKHQLVNVSSCTNYMFATNIRVREWLRWWEIPLWLQYLIRRVIPLNKEISVESHVPWILEKLMNWVVELGNGIIWNIHGCAQEWKIFKNPVTYSGMKLSVIIMIYS